MVRHQETGGRTDSPSRGRVAVEAESVRRLLLAAVGVAVAARRAPLAVAPAAPAVAAAAAVAVAAAARAAVAATAAGADRGQLLDGLAGNLRVLGEAQADAAALAV